MKPLKLWWSCQPPATIIPQVICFISYAGRGLWWGRHSSECTISFGNQNWYQLAGRTTLTLLFCYNAPVSRYHPFCFEKAFTIWGMVLKYLNVYWRRAFLFVNGLLSRKLSPLFLKTTKASDWTWRNLYLSAVTAGLSNFLTSGDQLILTLSTMNTSRGSAGTQELVRPAPQQVSFRVSCHVAFR